MRNLILAAAAVLMATAASADRYDFQRNSGVSGAAELMDGGRGIAGFGAVQARSVGVARQGTGIDASRGVADVRSFRVGRGIETFGGADYNAGTYSRRTGRF